MNYVGHLLKSKQSNDIKVCIVLLRFVDILNSFYSRSELKILVVDF